jgi:hypothetical protein
VRSVLLFTCFKMKSECGDPTLVGVINLVRLEPMCYRADRCKDEIVTGVKDVLRQAVIF